MTSHSLAPGDVIGDRYRIVRLLGTGGMGLIFEAENVLIHKRVALKWMRPVAGQTGVRRQLLLEAQAGARVRHRNVVDIYDVGFANDGVYLVMELLEGQTLASLLSAQTISIPALIALLVPVMRAVGEAHRKGVIHRDIKPENIFLSSEVDELDPVPVVLDFGIAKLEERLLVSRSGTAKGTPPYMSFEQLCGHAVDIRTDVYGFGVLLYLALTGSFPHIAYTVGQLVLSLLCNKATPIHVVRPSIPRALSDAIDHALAVEREQRTCDMEALIRELTPFASESGYLAHADSIEHTRRIPRPPIISAAGPPAASADRHEKSNKRPVRVADPAVPAAGSDASTTPPSTEHRARRESLALALLLAAFAAAGGLLSCLLARRDEVAQRPPDEARSDERSSPVAVFENGTSARREWQRAPPPEPEPDAGPVQLPPAPSPRMGTRDEPRAPRARPLSRDRAAQRAREASVPPTRSDTKGPGTMPPISNPANKRMLELDEFIESEDDRPDPL